MAHNCREARGIILFEMTHSLTFGEECDAFQRQIVALLGKRMNRIVLNLEECGYCDSAGLHCLISTAISTKKQGGGLKLIRPSERIWNLLDLTKLSTVFEIYNTEEEALASFE